ncbi:MAG: 4-oxalocrotonate tautomerase [Hadesarchaea archaeon YNP_N21]|nr:MAG: 4-oxalocrotonate tautomerase [Hadesarchaea archaeon YNP_N21]
MLIVTIDLWEGRTVEQKREIVRAVTSALANAAGCPTDAVWVIIRDVSKNNWGMGGKLASEVFP